jgi:hypothetical protein
MKRLTGPQQGFTVPAGETWKVDGLVGPQTCV